MNARYLLVSALLFISASAMADDTWETIRPTPELWERFKLADYKIGTSKAEVEKEKGWICEPSLKRKDMTPNSFGHCVRFSDSRCKSGTCALNGRLTPSFQLSGTLNGADVELERVVLGYTGVPDQRVHEITRFFPLQLLTKDSNLGKALIEKFGEPAAAHDDPDPAKKGQMCGTMSWNSRKNPGTVSIEALCCNRPDTSPPHEMCRVSLSANGYFDEVQNQNREAFKNQSREGTDKPAPKL